VHSPCPALDHLTDVPFVVGHDLVRPLGAQYPAT
jgi:hypothetical protein